MPEGGAPPSRRGTAAASKGARAIRRASAHALAIAAVLSCFVLPTSPYEWVRDLAPGIDPTGFEDGGDRTAALGLPIVAALALELLVVATARSRRERSLAAVLAFAVAVTGSIRLLS